MACRLLERTTSAPSLMPVLAQAVTSEHVDNILSLYDFLGRKWLEVMLVVENLDYSSAAMHIPEMSAASAQLLAAAVQLEDSLRAAHCAVGGGQHVDIAVLTSKHESKAWLACAVAITALLVWMYIRRSKSPTQYKAKLN